jgi:hypothetical protein
MQWHRLYHLTVPKRGKPWHFKALTVRHIYFPLARSSGKILELLKALKSKDGDPKKKLFQFLNVIGESSLAACSKWRSPQSTSSNTRIRLQKDSVAKRS